MFVVLAALIWFPDFSGSASVAHELGMDARLRGQFSLSAQIGIAQKPQWHLGIFIDQLTYVRPNRGYETAFRISPEQIHFPVGATLSFPMEHHHHTWGLLVMHQSNHDVDSIDAALARETLSFEYYAVFIDLEKIKFDVGVYYDRGTRLSGRKQIWPFDYLLAGTNLFFEWLWTKNASSRVQLQVVAHRNPRTSIPFVDVGHAIDVGWQWVGKRANSRFSMSYERINNYQFLGDQPLNIVLLGLTIASAAETP